MHTAILSVQRLDFRQIIQLRLRQLTHDPSESGRKVGNKMLAAEAGLIKVFQQILYLQIGICTAVCRKCIFFHFAITL